MHERKAKRKRVSIMGKRETEKKKVETKARKKGNKAEVERANEIFWERKRINIRLIYKKSFFFMVQEF